MEQNKIQFIIFLFYNINKKVDIYSKCHMIQLSPMAFFILHFEIIVLNEKYYEVTIRIKNTNNDL